MKKNKKTEFRRHISKLLCEEQFHTAVNLFAHKFTTNGKFHKNKYKYKPTLLALAYDEKVTPMNFSIFLQLLDIKIEGLPEKTIEECREIYITEEQDEEIDYEAAEDFLDELEEEFAKDPELDQEVDDLVDDVFTASELIKNVNCN